MGFGSYTLKIPASDDRMCLEHKQLYRNRKRIVPEPRSEMFLICTRICTQVQSGFFSHWKCCFFFHCHDADEARLPFLNLARHDLPDLPPNMSWLSTCRMSGVLDNLPLVQDFQVHKCSRIHLSSQSLTQGRMQDFILCTGWGGGCSRHTYCLDSLQPVRSALLLVAKLVYKF